MAIMVTRSSMPDIEDFIEEIKPIFENHVLTNMGPIYQKLQSQLKDYLKVENLSLFVNGHMALELALQALGLRDKGGEVITTPFTFVSTTHSIVRNELTPVFCDIKADDYTIDPSKIEALITDKTVAILPVHVYGNICDVDAIETIAKKYNLKVIYDAAHAFGVTYKSKGIGSYGDASMFSFHATKVFNTIEGGAIAFKDENYTEVLDEIKNFGLHEKEDAIVFGSNAKLDEFRAAMGVCNLKNIDKSLLGRKKAYDQYIKRLDNVEGLYVINGQKDVNPNYAYFPLLIDAETFGKSRDDIYTLLESQDIYSRKYFYPCINDMSVYKGKYKGDTPIARQCASQILTLPLYEELTIDEVDMICDFILGEE